MINFIVYQKKGKNRRGGEKGKGDSTIGRISPIAFVCVCVVVDRFHGAIRMRKKALIDTRQAIDNAACEPGKKRVFCIIPLISSVTLMIFEVSSGQILNYSRQRERETEH
jgi:hypothetical protein